MEPLADQGSARQNLADLAVAPRTDRIIRRLFVVVGYLLILGGFFVASRDLFHQFAPAAQWASSWFSGSASAPVLTMAPPAVDILADGFGPAVAQAALEREIPRPSLDSERESAVLGAAVSTEIEAGEDSAISLPRRVTVPALGVTGDIVPVAIQSRTWNVRWIGSDVAYLEGTGSLGQGNLVLAAHITLWGGGDGPFRRLFALERGDQVALFSGDEVFHYRVRENRVVEPTDVSVVMPSAQPTLTLLTCSEWDPELGQYTMRRAVIADLIRTDRTLMR